MDFDDPFMDMDADVPLLDELEWLESHALLPDDEDHPSPPFEEPPPRSPPSSSDPPPRPLSYSPPSPPRSKRLAPPEIEDPRKRSRTTPDPDADEDWPRLSPTRDPRQDAAAAAAASAAPEEKVLSRFATEIEGECVPVTAPCGERVYAKVSRWETIGRGDAKRFDSAQARKGLLPEPINVLIDRVELEAFTKALEVSAGSIDDSIHPDVSVVTEQLWVDKYAPSSFTELLSDEQTNREVLMWLKQWDACVFGSQIRATSDDVLSSLRRHSSPAQNNKFSDVKSFFSKNRVASFSKNFFNQSNSLSKVHGNQRGISEHWKKRSSVDDPPEQKVLLLCGPPGLGKTTLAHVAAKHCGYRVVEINASDDRSSSTVESKILDVVQMNSVMADAKPQCLVIDEIDGALGEGKGAVEAILKLVAAEKKSAVGKENFDEEVKSGEHSSKKGVKASKLSRPVICICNDLFAPALRPLRQVAKVHTFVQPTVSRVVNRLKFICNKEGFKTSPIALTALAEYTECDIRSCLNTLQFLNKKKEALNVVEVGSQVVGRKDMSKSVFDVWKEVFWKKKAKRERKPYGDNSNAGTDFDILSSLISNRGDYELIMDGVHENFLQLHYHDPLMKKTVKCQNILGVSDLLVRYVGRTQQMSLNVYQPFMALTIHSILAQVQKPNIEWPKSLQRYRAMFMEKKDTLKNWQNKISPSISRHLSIESFVEYSISPLLHILSPSTLRPVALHLLSDRERDELAQLVDTMVSYSVTYKSLKSELPSGMHRHQAASDASMLTFDPPIDDFVNFKGYHSGHFVLSLAAKQVVVHEVENQKILRESITRDGSLNAESTSGGHAFTPEGNTKEMFPETKPASFAVTSAANMRFSFGQKQGTANGSKLAVGVSIKLNGPRDAKKPFVSSSSFFDRFRKLSSKSSQSADDFSQKPATLERDLRPLLFKFNEGFTNAVKRPVRIRELL